MIARFYRVLLVWALMGISGPVLAATATTSFTVTGTVVSACSVAASALTFGTAIPNPINTNIDSTSTVTATCSVGAPYTVALNRGNGAGATFAARRMTSGPNTLVYNLYQNAARTIIWGDGTGGSVLFNGVGNGAAQVITVFGRINSGQTVATGLYSDTIVVTLTF